MTGSHSDSLLVGVWGPYGLKNLMGIWQDDGIIYTSDL